jgi:maltose alpha-D-glucosyltransferase/alpha-amylase
VEVLDALKNNLSELPEKSRSLANQVLSLQSTMILRQHAVADMPIDAQRIRLHGDYHLAQVLYTGKDFVIMDFEGEWSRPMSERRIKRSPLRDAVSMIRSFDYAAHIALAREQERGHFSVEQQAGMDPRVRFWSRWTGATFLRGYLGALAPAELLPRDPDQMEVLVNALLLNRTLGELGHEMTNRPESLHIPLKSVLDLMGAP